jgi:hypothetical protein
LLFQRGYEVIGQNDCWTIYRRPDVTPSTSAAALGAKVEGVE